MHKNVPCDPILDPTALPNALPAVDAVVVILTLAPEGLSNNPSRMKSLRVLLGSLRGNKTKSLLNFGQEGGRDKPYFYTLSAVGGFS